MVISINFIKDILIENTNAHNNELRIEDLIRRILTFDNIEDFIDYDYEPSDANKIKVEKMIFKWFGDKDNQHGVHLKIKQSRDHKELEFIYVVLDKQLTSFNQLMRKIKNTTNLVSLSNDLYIYHHELSDTYYTVNIYPRWGEHLEYSAGHQFFISNFKPFKEHLFNENRIITSKSYKEKFYKAIEDDIKEIFFTQTEDKRINKLNAVAINHAATEGEKKNAIELITKLKIKMEQQDLKNQENGLKQIIDLEGKKSITYKTTNISTLPILSHPWLRTGLGTGYHDNTNIVNRFQVTKQEQHKEDNQNKHKIVYTY